MAELQLIFTYDDNGYDVGLLWIAGVLENRTSHLSQHSYSIATLMISFLGGPMASNNVKVKS
jgi:hypothetical protein